MAYFQRKSNGSVKVYLWASGKQKMLPRDETRHLDVLSDDAVKRWVENYTHNVEKRIKRDWVIPPETLRGIFESYIALLVKNGKDRRTVNSYRYGLNHCFDYYLNSFEKPLADFLYWTDHSARLLEYLEAKKISYHNILRVNTAVTGFWRYLQEENLVDRNLSLFLRRPVRNKRDTPLKNTLTPDDILAYVKKTFDPQLKLMALLGYFFSLRTQEVFALKKRSFSAGRKAVGLEASKVMSKYELFDLLCVNVTRQRTPNGEMRTPKSGSSGWVACFHHSAAALIVGIVNTYDDPDQFLFDYLPDWNIKRWAKDGIPGVSLKDLRRASLYWLGHYSDLPLVALKNHARHSKVETTALYTRRPGEETDEDDGDLDLRMG